MKILKIIVSLILSAVLFILPVHAEDEPFIKGDIDSDGVVSVSDARLALRFAISLDTPVDKERTVADMDSDGVITVSDARLILRIAIGLWETSTSGDPFNDILAEFSSEYVAVAKQGEEKLLFSKNINVEIAPASLVKLLTAITALKYADGETVFTVGKEISMIGPYSSICYLQEGWAASLNTLIKGMLVSSGNDAAYCIAVNVAKAEKPELTDEEAVLYFVELMNKTATEMGMKNSKFINPDGYDEKGQYTTVEDLLLLAKEAKKNDYISSVCSEYRSEAYLADETGVVWYNTNRFLNPSDEKYNPLIDGLKTGSTDSAGCCLISTFTYHKNEYYIVLCGAKDDETRYNDTMLLMDVISNTQ